MSTPALPPVRHARITGLGHADLDRVRRFLPSNYTADSDGGSIWIHGTDSHGWTLDGYVIPRLASGLIRAEEFVPPARTPRVAFRCLECGQVWTVEDDANEWAYGHDCEA